VGIALGELLLEYLVPHLAEAVVVTVGRHALRQATRHVACGLARAVPRAPHSPRELRQPMVPGACSQLPGRVRLAVPGLRDSPTIIPPLLAHLQSLPGIRSATASALTGNALIVYDPQHVSLAAILAVVAAEPTACGTAAPHREWWGKPEASLSSVQGSTTRSMPSAVSPPRHVAPLRPSYGDRQRCLERHPAT